MRNVEMWPLDFLIVSHPLSLLLEDLTMVLEINRIYVRMFIS